MIGARPNWTSRGKTYRYREVPPDIYTDLLDAKSQGEFFNPYNLPADWVPPPPVPETGPPVEPDRAKYNNPYEQPKPPQ